ncbi:MAG: DUF4385 family protein [Pedobacter sp.]
MYRYTSQTLLLGFITESDHWKPNIDYRQHPEVYRVDKGEQGVLSPNLTKRKFVNTGGLKLQTLQLKAIRSSSNFLTNTLRKVNVGMDMGSCLSGLSSNNKY